MTPEAQRIAIAEACGWRTETRRVWGGSVTRLVHPDELIGVHPDDETHELPDYLTDLNAMHEAEKVLDTTNGGPRSGDCLRYAYARELYKLVPEWQQPFRASAAQRAEAFLRVLDLWIE